MDNVIIRSEDYRDIHSIAGLHATAFIYSLGTAETTLVSVLRNRQAFDPELSLVAELDGRILGHALFTPYMFSIQGELVKGVILGPIAVMPEFQKQGVGSRLILEGHKRARKKGVHLSLLIGHPTYYPRHGYRQNAWGVHEVQIQLDDIPSLETLIEERRIEQADIPELSTMWDLWFREAMLAVKPGASLMDWISPGRGIQASAVTIEGRLSGYLRYDKANPGKPLCVLAKDARTLSGICGYLKSKITPAEETRSLSLPLPLNSFELSRWDLPYTASHRTSPERMLHILTSDHQELHKYGSGVAAGSVLPGPIQWPVEFDVC